MSIAAVMSKRGGRLEYHEIRWLRGCRRSSIPRNESIPPSAIDPSRIGTAGQQFEISRFQTVRKANS